MVDFTKRESRGGLEDLGGDGGDDAGGDRTDEGDHGNHGDDGTAEPADEPHAGDDTETHHQHHVHDVDSVGAAVVTVSSTRSLDDDPAGDAIVAGFEDAGHTVATRELIHDDYDEIQRSVAALADRDDVDVIVTTGGTGVTPDDVTPEAVEPLVDKQLPGFGELFRRLSFDEVGTRAMGSRATAGVIVEGASPARAATRGVPVFCLPGSESAVRLGVEELVLPEIGHLVGLAGRHGDEDGDG